MKSKLPSAISYSEENTKHVKPTLIIRSLMNFEVPFFSIMRTEKKPDSKKIEAFASYWYTCRPHSSTLRLELYSLSRILLQNLAAKIWEVHEWLSPSSLRKLSKNPSYGIVAFFFQDENFIIFVKTLYNLSNYIF